jgi:hypothetical protein
MKNKEEFIKKIVARKEIQELEKTRKPGFIVVENEGFGYYEERIPGLQKALNKCFPKDVIRLVPKQRIDDMRSFVFNNLKLFVKIKKVQREKVLLCFYEGRKIKDDFSEIIENNKSIYDFEFPDPKLRVTMKITCYYEETK